jgi:trans-2,3-dihydro-3-hydroxyanthranilate isomerase
MTTRQARYMLFDVFTDVAYAGNPLAIFPESQLEDASMQRIARELNLSESVFLRPGAGCVAELRIFTPQREVDFAGHPTIGTAIALVDHLWWVGPNESTFVLREPVGDVPIAIERATPTVAWLTMPPVQMGAHVSRDDAAALLHLAPGDLRDDLPPQLAGAGEPYLYVPLTDAAAVDRAVLDTAALKARPDSGILGGVYPFAQVETGAYARMFAPNYGIAEDPATGSATGPLYTYLAAHAALPRRERFVNEQGVAMGRRSVLHVRLHWEGDRLGSVEVGGSAVFVGEGTLQV